MNTRRAHFSLRSLGSVTAIAAACSLAACDEDPSVPKLGSMEITTSAPSVEKDFTTTDGWLVKYDRFLVHVTAVNVAGADQVLAASSAPQIVDQVAPGAKSLLSAPLRTARPWEDVSLQIGPAAPDIETTVIEPVKEADRDMMQKDGLALYVEGKASKQGIVKAFKWGLSMDTLYKGCEETQNGNVVRGLVVPPDGSDTADFGMSGEVLFSDDLAGGALRADAIVLADADNDGTVTVAELKATSLESARASGARYETGDGSAITDLGSFIEALAPRIVTRFRAAGRCIAEPATPTP